MAFSKCFQCKQENLTEDLFLIKNYQTCCDNLTAKCFCLKCMNNFRNDYNLWYKRDIYSICKTDLAKLHTSKIKHFKAYKNFYVIRTDKIIFCCDKCVKKYLERFIPHQLLKCDFCGVKNFVELQEIKLDCCDKIVDVCKNCLTVIEKIWIDGIDYNVCLDCIDNYKT